MLLVWLTACGAGDSDRLSPVRAALAPAELLANHAAALPQQFVLLDLEPHTLSVAGIGVGLEPSSHTLNPEDPALDQALLPTIFDGLDLPPGPVVVVLHPDLSPQTARTAIESAARLGGGPFTVLRGSR